jgi:hypothetical protein
VLIAFAMKARAQSADGASVLVAPAGEAPAPSGKVRIVTPVPPSLTPVAIQSPLVSAPGPAKPARVPLGKRWWFWASLGAATVGVVLAAIFLGPRDPYNGNASPGTVTIF